jgi:hypothetical protein
MHWLVAVLARELLAKMCSTTLIAMVSKQRQLLQRLHLHLRLLLQHQHQ